MRHISLFAFFVFVFSFSEAQSIVQFKCYLRSNCNIVVVELKEYSLRKEGFFYSSLNGGSVANLPDTGHYILESSHIATEGDSLVVYINYGINIDTIKKRDLVDIVFIDSKPLKGMKQGGGWFCCGKPCQGYNVDYYNNGQKMVEGIFNKGKPIGRLRFYSSIGKLKYVEYYNKRGRMIKSEQVK